MREAEETGVLVWRREGIDIHDTDYGLLVVRETKAENTTVLGTNEETETIGERFPGFPLKPVDASQGDTEVVGSEVNQRRLELPATR